jgi:hypothetical protein
MPSQSGTRGGEHLRETGNRGEPRVMGRPEIDDGEALARETRDPDASRARLLIPTALARPFESPCEFALYARVRRRTARRAKPRARREAAARQRLETRRLPRASWRELWRIGGQNARSGRAASSCAGHAQQSGGASPPANLMEVKA